MAGSESLLKGRTLLAPTDCPADSCTRSHWRWLDCSGSQDNRNLGARGFGFLRRCGQLEERTPRHRPLRDDPRTRGRYEVRILEQWLSDISEHRRGLSELQARHGRHLGKKPSTLRNTRDPVSRPDNLCPRIRRYLSRRSGDRSAVAITDSTRELARLVENRLAERDNPQRCEMRTSGRRAWLASPSSLPSSARTFRMSARSPTDSPSEAVGCRS